MSNKIILVGNGSNATEREAGDLIDSYETVVRFNNFETRGYEPYVGRRTDIWSTRICNTIRHQPSFNFKEIIGVINWCLFTPAIHAVVPRFVQRYPRMTIIHSDQVKGYSEMFGYDHQKNWLSVGMITILHLLDQGHEQLHLYGFEGNPKKHYFNMLPRGENFHKFDIETEYIDKLVEEGKVVRI